MQLEIDEQLVCLIQTATKNALQKLFSEHNEHFYYCSLITTGEGLSPILTAWSVEALDREANECDDVEDAKYYLKWSYDESPYFAYGEEFFEDVKAAFIERTKRIENESENAREVSIRINSMEKAMHNLDDEGLFGVGEQRQKIVVNAEFMPPDYTNTERALRLNPREALNQWLEEIAEEI
ncbi:MAG: DUF4303 domain-containing protein [Pseudobutyrivibrio sp.]|nr:DUF4303 domain-containing protein [Pseudobutyrivibrio sp.]